VLPHTAAPSSNTLRISPDLMQARTIWQAPMAACVLLALLMTARAAPPAEVVQLSLDTFETWTQASTGQTAGHWFVLFASSKESEQEHALWKRLANKQASALESLDEPLDGLASQEEQERLEANAAVFGFVDVSDVKNAQLVKQFKVQPPSAILFRDRMMHIFSGDLTAENAESVLQFALAGFSGHAQAVPGAVKQAKAPENTQAPVWAAWQTGAVLMVVGLVAGVVMSSISAGTVAAAKKTKPKTS